MTARFSRLLIAPAAVLAAGACFATRSDVRLLQDDIGRLQASAARAAHADTLQSQQLQQIVRALGAVSDSLRLATVSLQRFQGDVAMSMHGVESQLLTIQELTGQSRKQLDAMRAQIEARASDASVSVALPGAAVMPGAAPAGGQAAPGPYQLMELGTQQLKKGAASAARAALSDLIAQFPGSDLVPEAQYKIAESFTSAGSAVEADSVYALVAERYPASEYAPNAIYKRALALKVAGQTRQARTLLQQVLDKYPKSDAAILAASLIRDLK